MNDLKIGAAMIKEALDRENVKEAQAQRRKEEEKAAQEAAKAKVLFGDILALCFANFASCRSNKPSTTTGRAGR